MPLLAGLGPLGVPELLIIAFIVVLIFGVGRLPEVGGALGKGIREFRKSSQDEDSPPVDRTSADTTDADASTSVGATAAGADTVFCSECGTKNTRGAKFCSSCGHSIGAAVS
jgi:sec-independent protein translocase protein TatA